MQRKIHFVDGREVETKCLSCSVANELVEATGGVINGDAFFYCLGNDMNGCMI